MITNLTEYQLEVANWLAQQHENRLLPETFSVSWDSSGSEKLAKIKNYKGKQFEITFAALEILEQEQLLRTVNKEIYDPPKPSRARGAYAPVYVFPVKKHETGRTYTLRNDIFRARDLYLKRQLVKDAEKILEFMIARPSGMQFATRPELMSALQMNDERYEQVCQFLEDFELIQHIVSVGMLWGNIGPSKRGRQVMHERSLESLLLTQSPIVNYNLGDQISVTNTGKNVSIAAVRKANASQGLTAAEIDHLFQNVFQKLEQDTDLPNSKKEEIKETIELIKDETQKGTDANEKALSHYFRTLARMAPDILDVVVATVTNPILGAGTIIRKVAEKAKAEADN